MMALIKDQQLSGWHIHLARPERASMQGLHRGHLYARSGAGRKTGLDYPVIETEGMQLRGSLGDEFTPVRHEHDVITVLDRILNDGRDLDRLPAARRALHQHAAAPGRDLSMNARDLVRLIRPELRRLTRGTLCLTCLVVP
jgi:hypothetical protein